MSLSVFTRPGLLTKFIHWQHIRLSSTIDFKDVEHHSKLMNNWWGENSVVKPLHSLNIIRVPHIRDGLVKKPITTKYSECLKGFKILDVGCGGGIFSEDLAMFGAQVTGIDASKDLISMAKQHSMANKRLENNMPTYIHTTMEEHAAQFPDYYDAIAASEILEHVNNKMLFLQSCIIATKPGGKLFFTTPTRSRSTQLFFIFLTERILKIIPKGTHQYEKFITPNELKYYLELNDCKVESRSGMVYHFWSNKWEWIESQTLHFAMQAKKLK